MTPNLRKTGRTTRALCGVFAHCEPKRDANGQPLLTRVCYVCKDQRQAQLICQQAIDLASLLELQAEAFWPYRILVNHVLVMFTYPDAPKGYEFQYVARDHSCDEVDHLGHRDSGNAACALSH